MNEDKPEDNPAWVALTESETVKRVASPVPLFSQELLNKFYSTALYDLINEDEDKDHTLDAFTYNTP